MSGTCRECVYRYNSQTDKLHMSYTVVKRSKLSLPGRLVIDVFRLLRLVHVRKSKAGSEEVIECSNMTIINLALNVLGPTHEASLTTYLLIAQVRIWPFSRNETSLTIDLLNEERLNECGLTTLETRRSRGDQIEVFKIFMVMKIYSNEFFSKLRQVK